MAETDPYCEVASKDDEVVAPAKNEQIVAKVFFCPCGKAIISPESADQVPPDTCPDCGIGSSSFKVRPLVIGHQEFPSPELKSVVVQNPDSSSSSSSESGELTDNGSEKGLDSDE